MQRLNRLEEQLKKLNSTSLTVTMVDVFGNSLKHVPVQSVEVSGEYCCMCQRTDQSLFDGQLCQKCYQLYEYGETKNE